jgi:hypothetical protein
VAISENLAGVLHTIVDHLPFREESTRNDAHASITAEADDAPAKGSPSEGDDHEGDAA